MSKNIHFIAEREIIVMATGKQETQSSYFREVWQTPTDATNDILDQPDPVEAYRQWALAASTEYQVPIYADDDIMCSSDIIGYETRNSGKDHIENFDLWLAEKGADGYEISAEGW